MVILQKEFIGQFRTLFLRQVKTQRMMETMNIILIITFKIFFPQMLGQLIETRDSQKMKQPLIENQFSIEGNSGPEAASK